MSEREPSVIVEADKYNAVLIAGKTIRSVEKRGTPVTLELRPGKSVELIIAIAALIQGARAAVSLAKELDRYLKNREQHVRMKRTADPTIEEHVTIRRTETWVEYTRRRVDHDED